MMPIMLAAALSLAPLAPAFADGERWEFRISNEISPAEPTARIELWAYFDPSDYAFARAGLDVLASEPGWVVGSLLEMGRGEGIGTTPGEIVGPNVLGIIAGQMNFSPVIAADPSNPILVWEAEFATSDFQPRTISLATQTEEFLAYLLYGVMLSESRIASLTEGSGEITVIPAPGALAVGAGAMWVACLRRRRR